MFLGLLEMLLKTGDEFRIGRGLSHLRERFDDLVLRAVEIFQFVNIKVFE